MVLYLDVLILLNFMIDGILLIGTERLCGSPVISWRRVLPAAVLGGVYGGACLMPGFHFLGNLFWRVVCLLLMSMIAFGISVCAIRRSVVFMVLSMALGGVAVALETRKLWELLIAALVLCTACAVGIGGKVGSRRFVPVELCHNDHKVQLMALVDTGNTLCDPITGRSVLVVGAQIATKLLGLTPDQLRAPVEAITKVQIPGLRLIPYSSVGQPGSFLLAMRMRNVKIGNRNVSTLVAFSPERMEHNGYQALTGGNAI